MFPLTVVAAADFSMYPCPCFNDHKGDESDKNVQYEGTEQEDIVWYQENKIVFLCMETKDK
jgi:hypothetical protein